MSSLNVGQISSAYGVNSNVLAWQAQQAGAQNEWDLMTIAQGDQTALQSNGGSYTSLLQTWNPLQLQGVDGSDTSITAGAANDILGNIFSGGSGLVASDTGTSPTPTPSSYQQELDAALSGAGNDPGLGSASKNIKTGQTVDVAKDLSSYNPITYLKNLAVKYGLSWFGILMGFALIVLGILAFIFSPSDVVGGAKKAARTAVKAAIV